MASPTAGAGAQNGLHEVRPLARGIRGLIENNGPDALETASLAINGERARAAALRVEPGASARIVITTKHDPPLTLSFWPLSTGAEPIVVPLPADR